MKSLADMKEAIVDHWIKNVGKEGKRGFWHDVNGWDEEEIINFYQQLYPDPCEHDVQAHNTTYGVVYWCNKCKKTPDEIRREQ